MEVLYAIQASAGTIMKEAGPTSPFLHFAEDKLQLIALSFMFIVYVIKVRWILKFKAGKERQPSTSTRNTNAKKGAVYSLFNIFMPWGMASYRQHPLFYLQFGLFHVAVAVNILMSLTLPYWPGIYKAPVILYGCQALFGVAAVIGAYRFLRRILNPYIRAISSPDDIFSIALLTVWFVFAVMAVPNNRAETEFWLLGYYLLTAFFLFYVPFSKISHYIFYPFTRWYLGKTLGHRGVYPLPVTMETLKREFMKPNPFMEGKEKKAAA